MTEFLEAKYGLEDISIRKVDQPFIKNYDTFLRTKHHKCTPISADKYVKHLKKIILLSLGNRWITENPFLHYKSNAKPTPRTILTKDEVCIIMNKKFACRAFNTSQGHLYILLLYRISFYRCSKAKAY